jgi:hypothetical protein
MSQHQKIHLHTETIQSVIIYDKIFMTKAFTTKLTDGSILEPHGFQNTSPTNLLKHLTTITKTKKSILKSTSSDGDLFFRGGSNVLKPNHITRYEYPCPLHLPRSSLCLQTPTNASRRSRPRGQGRANFSTDGTMFLTITRAYRDLPCASNLAGFSAHEKNSRQETYEPTRLHHGPRDEISWQYAFAKREIRYEEWVDVYC